jgi:hypothetical protein
MIIEQQQILTTQNLAVLFSGQDLLRALRPHLGEMARQCFRWICRRHQMKTDRWHARLTMVKNTAYAWRQMVFFLALLPADEVTAFLAWATNHLRKQPDAFQSRFIPALRGLVLAAAGRPPTDDPPGNGAGRLFLGWTKGKHWLLTAPPPPTSPGPLGKGA